MSDCLFILYDYMKEDTAFASLKENVIFELTKYFNNHIVEIDDIESHAAKDKAYYVYRRFKECKWITEEVGNNYQIYTSFEDYAIVILGILIKTVMLNILVWFMVYISLLLISMLKMVIKHWKQNIAVLKK